MVKRFLMWCILAFLITLFCCTLLPFKVLLILGILLFLLLIGAFFIRFEYKATIIVCLIFSLFGISLFGLQTLFSRQFTSQLLDREVKVSGVVTNIESSSDGSMIYYETVIREIDGKKVPLLQRNKARIYSRTERSYIDGDRISGKVKFFADLNNFGAGRENRILLNGYQDENWAEINTPDGFNLRRNICLYRQRMQENFKYAAPKTVGLLKSVCFGDKSELDDMTYVSMRRIGLSHIMAVSGLHLMFAVLIFGFIFLVCGVNYRVRYLLGIFAAVFFTAIVGFPLSCVRACIMVIVLSIGYAANLISDGLTSLSIAAFLIVLANPFSIRDVGFMLSVCATFGVIAWSHPIESFIFYPKIKNRPYLTKYYRKLTAAFSCSIAANIATLPIMLWVFGSFSPIAPISNLLLIYPFELFFMLGLAMILLGWIPGVGAAIGWVCNGLYYVLSKTAVFMGRWEFATIHKLGWAEILILAVLFAIIGISIYHFLRYKRRSFAPLLAAFCCFSLSFSMIYTPLHRDTSYKIAFIDVGQGSCTVISKGRSAVILDYGGSSDKRYNLIHYLTDNEIQTIELVALTHLHSDHTNGINTLLKNCYVDQLVYPDFEAAPELVPILNNDFARKLKSDEQFSVLDSVKIKAETFAMDRVDFVDQNERCVSYRIELGPVSLLITGDMTGEAELKNLAEIEDCTILAVSHHGSDRSSMYPFIKKCAPEIAVISVGENNYGLPKQEVVDRLHTICESVYITQQNGTIEFVTDGLILERKKYDR